MTKHMMIKKADKKMPNIFKLNKMKTITSTSVRSYLLQLAGLPEKPGCLIRFDGHNPNVPDTVIFDLAKYQVIKTKEAPKGSEDEMKS